MFKLDEPVIPYDAASFGLFDERTGKLVMSERTQELGFPLVWSCS